MPDEDTLLTQTDTNAVSDDQQAEDSTPTEDVQTEETAQPTEEKSDAATETEESDDETQEAGAPEEYEAFDVPEGYGVDETVLSEYQEWAQDNNLTQDQAQAGVNLVAKMKEAEMARWVEQQKTWVDQAKSDSEIGGEQFDQNISTAVKARNSFGTPEFSEMLDTSGLGNHPEMIRFLNRVGKAISEDRMVVGGADASQRTRESVLYPSMS